MHTLILPADNPNAIETALSLLKEGEILAFPTDTVYGLGSNAFHAPGIIKLFEAKGRDSNKAIAVLIGSLEQARLLTDGMTEIALRLSEAFWPGGLTLIVPRKSSLPELISTTNCVGIRIPNHPVALELLRSFGPLATTSANLSGKNNPQNAQDVFKQLNTRIPLILDGGNCPGGIPSTVVDCSRGEPVILREGAISNEAIQKVLNGQCPGMD
ncbi:MAG: L-threonylcarbamoyladenylate synthase [Chloroflexi bacterium]|nr:L-threonylcarbamoyladenylate synthase [Chloroflexota bacterium]